MFDRRSLLKAGLVGGVGLPVAAGTAGAAGTQGRFTHGVASGDPLARQVILWTRYVPAAEEIATLGWEVATDEGFKTIVRSGTVKVRPDRDFTAKVDVDGLAPGKRYAYRFRDAAGLISPVGETLTMPEGRSERLRLGVFSCANLPFGYFNAYGHCAARDDIDLVVHLGDYIYETPRGVYPSAQEAVGGRIIEPGNETVTLADYRARYASYRADLDVAELHRRKPMIAVWDDHEFTNNAWRDGADNHQPETEGAWPERWRAAYRAFCEWMPIREQAEGVIYRRFDWGNLASLIMLDTRFIGRDKQLDYRPVLQGVDISDKTALAEALRRFEQEQLRDPKRTLLGEAQENWLRQQLAQSKARGVTWQVLGQQIQTGWFRMPPELPDYTRKDLPDSALGWIRTGSLVGGHGLPANLDAWAGYPAARDRLVADMLAHANNAVILAGDTHSAWAFELAGGPNGRPAAVELGCTSVTSPGMERYFDGDEAVRPVLVSANPELKWCSIGPRGYLSVAFTPDETQAEWLMMKTIRERTTELAGKVEARLAATAGAGTEHLKFAS